MPRNVLSDMSSPAASQKLFSPTFLREALTQEVHRLLSLQYARPILEALEANPGGQDVRWLDVKIVGTAGSARTAYVVVQKLSEAGWLAPKAGSKPQLWVLTPRGRDALHFARQGDSIGKGGAGVH